MLCASLPAKRMTRERNIQIPSEKHELTQAKLLTSIMSVVRWLQENNQSLKHKVTGVHIGQSQMPYFWLLFSLLTADEVGTTWKA